MTVELTIRQRLNLFDRWNNEVGFIDPISGNYFELLSIIKQAVIAGYKTKIKEESSDTMTYDFVDWFLYATAPHSDVDALNEWYTVV